MADDGSVDGEIVENIATLEGGPFDGAELRFNGDVWPADIIVAVPRKCESDTDEIYRGVALHQYGNCYSGEEDGVMLHYMGHVSHIAMTIQEMNAMFPPKGLKT